MTNSDEGFRELLPELLSAYADAMPVVFKPEVQKVIHVLHAWFLRCQRGIEAVLVLDEAGYLVESAPIRRSVIEHLIGLAWLSENPETGMNVLLRGGAEAATRWKKSLEVAGWTSVDFASFDAVIADGVGIDASTDNQVHFYPRCQLVGTPHDYASYLIETAQSHPSWQSAVPYLELNHETGTTLFRGHPFDDMNVGSFAAIRLYYALEVINSVLVDAPLTGQLSDLRTRLKPIVALACEERGLPVPDDLLVV